MAGIQKYTSSLFVQSGSRAKFESGLEVTESVIIAGTVSASGYFDLDGNEITGGGVAEEFFAGSGSGVSSSTPSSVSTFVQLSTGETITSNIFIQILSPQITIILLNLQMSFYQSNQVVHLIIMLVQNHQEYIDI